MKTLEELTPSGCRWPFADLCTAREYGQGPKRGFSVSRLKSDRSGTQLYPYCATRLPAMAYNRVEHQSINDRAKAHRKKSRCRSVARFDIKWQVVPLDRGRDFLRWQGAVRTDGSLQANAVWRGPEAARNPLFEAGW